MQRGGHLDAPEGKVVAAADVQRVTVRDPLRLREAETISNVEIKGGAGLPRKRDGVGEVIEVPVGAEDVVDRAHVGPLHVRNGVVVEKRVDHQTRPVVRLDGERRLPVKLQLGHFRSLPG